MGNLNCCGSRKELRKFGLKPDDLRELEQLFKTLVDSQPETKGGTEFNKKALIALFEENPQFAAKLFRFMKIYTHEPENRNRGIDLETFLLISEVLIAERGEITLREFKKLEKHFVLAMIFIGRKDLTDELDFRGIKLSRSDAIEFAGYILRMFQFDRGEKQEVDESVALSIIESVDANHLGELDWWNLLTFIRHNLIYIHTGILFYFRIKLQKKTYKLKLPELTEPSALITNDLLGLFALSNIHIQENSKLTLLYSSMAGSFSFQKLAAALRHPGSTLVLVRHVQRSKEGDQRYIFGGFANKPWSDDAQFSDDDRSYIFSVFPKFQNFFFRPQPNETVEGNFTYFNTDKLRNQNVGIGFGGNLQKGCRLWLDANIQERSYVRYEDGTYEPGSLLPAFIKRLEVDYLEVWGLEPLLRNTEVKVSLVDVGIRKSATARTNSAVVRPSRQKITNRATTSFERTENLLLESLAGLEQERNSFKSRRTTSALNTQNSALLNQTIETDTHAEADTNEPSKQPSRFGRYNTSAPKLKFSPDNNEQDIYMSTGKRRPVNDLLNKDISPIPKNQQFNLDDSPISGSIAKSNRR